MKPNNTEWKKHRKWRHLLLDRHFQLKYTGMIVGVASLISIVLGSFLMSTVRENSRMLEVDPEIDAVLQAQLAEADAHVLFVMIAAFVAFNIVLAVLAVFVTHRMAGPIFVMRRYVREIGEGKLPNVRKLRKGDEFVELIDEMSHTVQELEMRVKGEVEMIERAIEALKSDDSAAAASCREELAKLIETKRLTLASHHA